MRAIFPALIVSILAAFPGSGHAGDRLTRVAAAQASEKQPAPEANSERYRGHFLDYSAIVGRQDFVAMVAALRRQVDMAEDVPGLSPRVLEFFRTIPISVSDVACLNSSQDKDGKDIVDPKAFLHPACYGMSYPENDQGLTHGSIWDSAKSRWTNPDPIALGIDTNLGVVMVRPILLSDAAYAKRPALLHELLHAYHHLVMPQGYQNSGILLHYNLAKTGKLYPEDAYFLTNEREFFAVTASVFLHGNDGPFTRANIKEKQPEYYKYLVFLFGFDPETTKNVPIASAQ